MSRSSRGFSVAHGSTGSGPVCPGAGTLTVNQLTSTDWELDYEWTPNVLVGTLTIQYSDDGSSWNTAAASTDANSGGSIEIDPSSYVSPGSDIYLRFWASDVGGCSDFFSNVVQLEVQP